MSDDITPQCSQLTQEVRYSEEICRWNSIQVSIVLVYLGGWGRGRGGFHATHTDAHTYVQYMHAHMCVHTHACTHRCKPSCLYHTMAMSAGLRTLRANMELSASKSCGKAPTPFSRSVHFRGSWILEVGRREGMGWEGREWEGMGGEEREEERRGEGRGECEKGGARDQM